jgi:hypothetical protein
MSLSPIRAVTIPEPKLDIVTLRVRAQQKLRLNGSPMDLHVACDGKSGHEQCLAAVNAASIVHAMALSWAKRQEALDTTTGNLMACAELQSSRQYSSKKAMEFAQLLSILAPADALNEFVKEYAKLARRSDDRSGFVTHTDVYSASDLLQQKCRVMKGWLHDSTTKKCRLTYDADPLDDAAPLRLEVKKLLLRVLNSKREALHFAHCTEIIRKRLVLVGGENTQTVYAEPYHWGYVAPERLLDAARRKLLHFSHSVEHVVLMDDVADQHGELTDCIRSWPVQILLLTNPERLSADKVIRRLNAELPFDLTAKRPHGTKAERRKMKAARR